MSSLSAVKNRLVLSRLLAVAAAVLVLLFLLLLPQMLGNVYYTQVLILIFLYAYMALAWNIIGGMAGQISFGHGIFFGIGAYTSTILFRDLYLSPWVGMFVGALLAMIAAVLVGYPCFRLRGAYFALATLAFQEIVRAYVTNTETVLGINLRGASGILLPLVGNSALAFQFDDKRYYYYIILIFLAVQAAVLYVLRRGKFGLYLSAIKNDEDAARTLGVNCPRMKMKALLISAFFSAIGGTFYAQLLRFIDADMVFGPLSTTFVLFAISGGPGYLLGPIVGTVLLMPIAEIARVSLAGTAVGVHLIIYGVILILVMLYMPKGILHEAQRLYERLFDESRRKKSEASQFRRTL